MKNSSLPPDFEKIFGSFAKDAKEESEVEKRLREIKELNEKMKKLCEKK